MLLERFRKHGRRLGGALDEMPAGFGMSPERAGWRGDRDRAGGLSAESCKATLVYLRDQGLAREKVDEIAAILGGYIDPTEVDDFTTSGDGRQSGVQPLSGSRPFAGGGRRSASAGVGCIAAASATPAQPMSERRKAQLWGGFPGSGAIRRI